MVNSGPLSARSTAFPSSTQLGLHSVGSRQGTGEIPSDLDDRAPGFVGLRLWVEQEVEAHVRKAMRELAPDILDGRTARDRELENDRLLLIEANHRNFALDLDKMREEWFGVVADENDPPSNSPARSHSHAGGRDASRKNRRAASSRSVDRSPSPQSGRSPSRSGDRGLLGGSKLRPLQLHIADQAKRCKALSEELTGLRESISCLRREARAAAAAAVSAQRHSDRVESQLASVSCDRGSVGALTDSTKLQETVEQAARRAVDVVLDERLTAHPKFSLASTTERATTVDASCKDRCLSGENRGVARSAHPSLYGAWAGEEESRDSDSAPITGRVRLASQLAARAKDSSTIKASLDERRALLAAAVVPDSGSGGSGASTQEVQEASDNNIVKPQLLNRSPSAERRRRGNASNQWLAGRGRHWRGFGSRAFSSDSEEADGPGTSRSAGPAIWKDSSPKASKTMSQKRRNGPNGLGTTVSNYSDSD